MLRAVISAGTQSTDVRSHYTENQLDKVTDCARLFDRLMGLLCSYRVEFAKPAAYIVAEYCSRVHDVTLYPAVKRVLILAMYKLVDICNEHSLRQLNSVLPPSSRHVFRLIFAQFNKYYRFSRRNAADTNTDFIQCLYSA